MKFIQFMLFTLSCIFLYGCQSSGQVTLKRGETKEVITVATGGDNPVKTREGILILPVKTREKTPIVVMIHGTSGPDQRYGFHTRKLLDRGIAVFQVDFKSGIFTGPVDRPKSSTFFVPFVAATLKHLRKDSRIDPDSIGLMGFSLGANLAIRSFPASFRNYMKAQEVPETEVSGFAAYVAYYPQCRYRIGDFRLSTQDNMDGVFAGGPLLIIMGSEDSYEEPEVCRVYMEKPNSIRKGYVDLMVLEGVGHGFDTMDSASFFDPIAKNHTAKIIPNREAAEKAGNASADFMARHLK